MMHLFLLLLLLLLLLLGHVAVLRTKIHSIATDGEARSVCRSVTIPEKTAEPIEMPFGCSVGSGGPSTMPAAQCSLKAKFHYAILLANSEPAHELAKWSATC